MAQTKAMTASTTKGHMISQTNLIPLAKLRFALLPAALLCSTVAFSQGPASDLRLESSSSDTAAAMEATANEALPNAPSALTAETTAEAAPLPAPQMTPATATSAGPIAPKYSKYISAGFRAQPLTAHDKMILGLRDEYAPFTFIGVIASAGYSHVTNGQPNFGTDKGAFGQRLYAAEFRDLSEGMFTDVIFAPLLHEDPRYYVEGSRHNFFHRTIYSVTRPIITRTDSGRTTVNGALLAGYAASSAISYTYYPEINQNFKDTAATFGGALAGAAVGFFVSEFSDDVLLALHLKKHY